MSDKNNRERELFSAALEMAEEERSKFLRDACGDDLGLFERLQNLLRSYQKESRFLKTPSPETLEEARIQEGPGTQIGRFKLLEMIGEGGMGIVYMAEQSEPVVRKVALKIIKLGMDTRQVIARFEAERQALALMEHPNIAKILDGGATDTGRPYFVMELVRGVPITDYCRDNELSGKERIELFLPVCQAIQSAHQKGVIHRDIKPSNVLVSHLDDQPIAKVIDFGIAKATNQKLTEKTFFTNYAAMIGTPAYMSPEQAKMSVIDVDTRTDVYSLGVLLYELLTGTTPFSAQQLRKAGYAEMQRIISEEQPERPSTRTTRSQAAKNTGTTKLSSNQKAIHPELYPELDWITMKCLEKNRRRRYETANDLAADLRRYLNDEPVSAIAPTFSYQVRKLYAKHKGVLRAIVAISVTLLLATVVSSFLAVRMNTLRVEAEKLRETETQLRIEAETERKRATTAEADVRQGSIDLENHLYVSDMLAVAQSVGNEELGLAKEILNRHHQEPSGNDLRGFEWRYFYNQSKGTQTAELQAHSGAVQRLHLSPSGEYLLTEGLEGRSKLWDRRSNQIVHQWENWKVAPSSDWSRIASVSEDGKVRLWEFPSLTPLHEWPSEPGVAGAPIFSQDGRFLAALTQQGSHHLYSDGVVLWDLETKQRQWSMPGRWKGLALSPSEPIVALHGWLDAADFPLQIPGQGFSRYPNPEIYLWNYATKELVATLTREEFDATGDMGLKFSKTGRFLANSIRGLPIQIWDVASGTLVASLPKSTAFTVFDFSPDDAFLATKGRRRSRVQIWEVTTGRLVSTLSHPKSVNDVVFDLGIADQIITCSEDQSIRVWNWKTVSTVSRWLGHGSDVLSIATDATGSIVLTGGKNGKVLSWDLVEDAEPDEIPNGYTINPPVFSPNARRMVINEWTGAWDLSQRTFSVAGYTPPGNWELSRPPITEEQKAARPVLWKQVVFDSANCKRLWELDNEEFALGFTPDGESLLTITENDVRYRMAQNGALMQTTVFESPIVNRNFDLIGPYRWFALSDDAKSLAVAEDYESIRLINLPDGTTAATLGEDAFAMQLRFNPRADRIVFASREGGTGIWNLEDNTVKRLTEKTPWYVEKFDVSPDGELLTAACSDYALRIWEVKTGELIHSITGFRDGLSEVSFSPDGKTLAVSHPQGPFVKLWNTRTWRAMGDLLHQRRHFGAWFSPDGRFLLSSVLGQGAKLWRAPLFSELNARSPQNKSP